jgi:hypothetical protein
VAKWAASSARGEHRKQAPQRRGVEVVADLDAELADANRILSSLAAGGRYSGHQLDELHALRARRSATTARLAAGQVHRPRVQRPTVHARAAPPAREAPTGPLRCRQARSRIGLVPNPSTLHPDLQVRQPGGGAVVVSPASLIGHDQTRGSSTFGGILAHGALPRSIAGRSSRSRPTSQVIQRWPWAGRRERWITTRRGAPHPRLRANTSAVCPLAFHADTRSDHSAAFRMLRVCAVRDRAATRLHVADTPLSALRSSPCFGCLGTAATAGFGAASTDL